MKEAPIQVTLTLPDGTVLREPDAESIEKTLRRKFDQFRTVGDIWLRCRPSDFWKDDRVNPEAVKRSSQIIFYLGREGWTVLIYSDGSLTNYYAYVFEPKNDVPFQAEDDGESLWLLNEKYLTPIDEASDLAFQLVEKHRFKIDEHWEPLQSAYED